MQNKKYPSHLKVKEKEILLFLLSVLFCPTNQRLLCCKTPNYLINFSQILSKIPCSLPLFELYSWNSILFSTLHSFFLNEDLVYCFVTNSFIIKYNILCVCVCACARVGFPQANHHYQKYQKASKIFRTFKFVIHYDFKFIQKT